MLIALEGIDGSGKSTQARLLFDYFKRNRIDAVLTFEPTDGPIGKMIRSIIAENKSFEPSAIQLLFSADRAYHIASLIKGSIEEGKVVITDRYIFSTIAYGVASGIDKRWLIDINSKFMLPDMTFVFDMSPRKAVYRLNERAKKFINSKSLTSNQKEALKDKAKATMFERVGFLGRVREAYYDLQADYKNYHIINADNTKAAVSKKIISLIEEKI